MTVSLGNEAITGNGRKRTTVTLLLPFVPKSFCDESFCLTDWQTKALKCWCMASTGVGAMFGLGVELIYHTASETFPFNSVV